MIDLTFLPLLNRIVGLWLCSRLHCVHCCTSSKNPVYFSM